MTAFSLVPFSLNLFIFDPLFVNLIMAWRYKLGKNLQELRFLYCEKSLGSKGVRYEFSLFQKLIS